MAKTLGNVPTSHRQPKLCFSQAGGNHSLNVALPCNGSKTEEHDESSHGVVGLEVGGMACIKGADQLIWKMRGKEQDWDLFPETERGSWEEH